MNSLYQSTLKSLPLLGRGKVRDNYAVGDDKILIVTSDRLSAFDVVMNEPIPGKGMVLNQMSDFWFEKLGHIVPNHLTGVAPESVVAADEVEQVEPGGFGGWLERSPIRGIGGVEEIAPQFVDQLNADGNVTEHFAVQAVNLRKTLFGIGILP